MKEKIKFLLTCLLLGTIVPVLLAQKQDAYCSKYRMPNSENQLAIEDFRSDSVDIIHTHIELTFPEVSTRFVTGRSQLKLIALVNDVSRLVLDFEGLQLDSVTGLSGLVYEQLDQKLIIDFSVPLSTVVPTELTFHYQGAPITDGSGWGGFYFQAGFIWNLGVGFESDPHSYGRVWFPCFDNFIERSSFSFDISVPGDKFAVCNGLLQDSSTTTGGLKRYEWHLEESIPSYLVCVAVGSYEVLASSYSSLFGGQNIPVELYARASDTASLKSSFVNLHRAIEAFESRYGVYRFSKVGYSLVPFNAGAMEHATNITYPIYAANGSLNNESLMAHELAHMWWGDNVTCETDGDMWINEGWASFSEYLFEEAVYGRDAYELAMLNDLKEMLQFGHLREGGYRPVAGQPHDLVYGDHVYKKGALVAHNLRGFMGDEAFFTAIQAFMDYFNFQPVSSDSIERFFSNYSGMDLVPFFRDWVYQGGYNVLVLDSFKSTANGNQYAIDLFIQQKLKGRSAFHDNTRGYYTIYDVLGNKEHGSFTMSGQFEKVTVTSSIEPVWVVLNEDFQMAWAATGWQDTLKTGSTNNFNLSNWNVNVSNVNGDALARIEQIWSYPDPLKDWNKKPYKLNSERYWRVDGLGLDQAELRATFFYDGRENSTAGRPDGELFNYNNEDSLVLLYRPSAKHDWEVYDNYEKNMLGNIVDAFGVIEIYPIMRGEYVLGVIAQEALGTINHGVPEVIRVYPNPNSGELTIEQESMLGVLLELYDLNGRKVADYKISQKQQTIQLPGLEAGMYLCRFYMDSGQVVKEQRLILKN